MRSVISIRLIAAACLTAGLGGMSVHAAVLEVGVGQTYTTITDAYAAANSNDVINIHAGVYLNDLSINDSTNTRSGITFQANKDDTGRYDKVVLDYSSDATRPYAYMRYASGYTFDGVIFKANTATGAVYLRDSFTGATFKNTIFYNPGGRGLYGYYPNNSNLTIENATFYGNDTEGLRSQNGNSGWSVKDSLFINNGTGAYSNSQSFTIDHAAFSGNTANTDGSAVITLTNTTTDAAPIFVSTDINDPYFLYLDPSSPQSILTGDSDGGFKGARGVVPEPASLALLGLSVAGLCLRRPRESRG